MAAIGVGGYVFRKKLVRPHFWRYFLYLYVLHVIFESGMALLNMYEHAKFSSGFWEMLFGLLVGTVMAAPGYVALYRYGSSKESPWRDEQV